MSIKKYKIEIYLSILIGILLSFGIFFFVQRIELNKIKLEFEYKSYNRLKAFEINIARNLDSVNLFESFFSNAKEPTREEFKNIAKSAIERNSIITGISWNPFVKKEERSKYEENAFKDGLNDFQFKEINSFGKIVVSSQKENYVPVYYIEPQIKNKKALGYDIFSNLERKKAINEARDTGKIILSDRINLVQEGKNSYGMLAIKAVYTKNSKHDTLEEKRKNFKGVIVGVFSFKEMNNKVLENFNTNDINMQLLDLSASPENQLLYSYSHKKIVDDNYTWMGKINVANKQWALKTIASSQYIKQYDNYYRFIFFVIGLILTFLWVRFLILKINYTLRLEKKVKIQTKQIQRNLDIISKYVIITRTDLKGNILYASDAFCSISQYKKDEILGKPQNIVRHPDMKKELFKDLWKTIQSGKSWMGEIKNLSKDGKYYWTDSLILPEFDNNDNIISYISIRHDITAKKDLEKEKEKIFEQSKLASMGQMLGNIAHQWRQPLSVITVATSGLQLFSKSNQLTDKKIDDFSNIIMSNATYLSSTIETFRNFIKEKKELKKISIQERIDFITSLLDASLKNNNIELINNIHNIDDVMIYTVVGELDEVLINIMNNSIDALKHKNILNAWIKLDLEKTDKNIIISIEDNAKGIDEEILPKIFEPYFTTKYESLGTGLGLHISHKIVTETLNGTIEAKNTRNGAIFIIKIPII